MNIDYGLIMKVGALGGLNKFGKEVLTGIFKMMLKKLEFFKDMISASEFFATWSEKTREEKFEWLGKALILTFGTAAVSAILVKLLVDYLDEAWELDKFDSPFFEEVLTEEA